MVAFLRCLSDLPTATEYLGGSQKSRAQGRRRPPRRIELNPTGHSQVVDELANGAVTRTCAYGLKRVSENQLISSAWTPNFYGYDGHGNVRFLANAAGSLTDTYQFDACTRARFWVQLH